EYQHNSRRRSSPSGATRALFCSHIPQFREFLCAFTFPRNRPFFGLAQRFTQAYLAQTAATVCGSFLSSPIIMERTKACTLVTLILSTILPSDTGLRTAWTCTDSLVRILRFFCPPMAGRKAIPTATGPDGAACHLAKRVVLLRMRPP